MQRKIDWEFWLDSNISPIIAKWLQDETGLIFKSAYSLNLTFLGDIEIYHLAKQNNLPVILISKDADFPLIINKYGSPPKLINIRIGNGPNKLIYKFISANLEEAIKQLIDDGADIVDLQN